MNMKLIYIANSRIPTERAHGLQIMKMCEQFAKNYDTELIVPRRINPIKQDPFIYYGVRKNFKITHLPVLDFVKLGRVGFWIESLVFSKIAAVYLFFKKTNIIYGRDELPLYFLSFFKKNIFWEAHQGRMNFAAKRLIKKAVGVITISEGLKNFYKRERGDILVSPDAVDFDFFNVSLSKEECRRKLSLPPDKKIVLYSGHLYSWKGAGVLLDASRNFNNNFLFVFVGGTEEDISKFKISAFAEASADRQNSKFKNVLIAGHRPHQEIPFWLKAADILVLPNSAKEDISRLFTSPMKLFEYMASGTPIVASDLPSIRETVGENEALFFRPDDAIDLADKIKYAFENYGEMRAKAESARQKVKNYTWDKRTENIFLFINKKSAAGAAPDVLLALIVGTGVALLGLPILKNISGFDAIFSVSRAFAYALLAFLLLGLPAGAVLGIMLARRIGRKKPVIFQLAKYGLVGWLNVFMYVGIFNFISWLTGIASGLMADLFLIVSFAATTTNAFFWNKLWTFGATDSGNGKTEYIKFFTITGLTTGLNIFLFHLMVNTIGAPAGFSEQLWANIVLFALIPVSLFGNFFGYRIFVFKRKYGLQNNKS